MFATSWSKSRVTSAGRASFSHRDERAQRLDREPRLVEVALFLPEAAVAERRDGEHGLDEYVARLLASRTPPRAVRAAPPADASCSGDCPSSATDDLRRVHLLRVDLLERPATLEPGDLTLGSVRGRNGQLATPSSSATGATHSATARAPHARGEPDTWRGRGGCPRGRSGSRARGSPRSSGAAASAVARPRRARVPCGRSARSRRRRPSSRRRGRAARHRSGSPPSGRRDAAGRSTRSACARRSSRSRRASARMHSNSAHVPYGSGNTAAREHPREDLRARRMEAAVHAFDERRARRKRQQVRQERAQPVLDGDRPVGAPDADVDVEAERVVPPDDVAKELVVPAVVRRIDDPLVLPAAPGMRSGRAEGDPEPGHQCGELRPALAHPLGRLGETGAPPGPHLDLARDQLADEVGVHGRARSGRLDLFEAVDERERLRIEEGELLLDGDGEVDAASRTPRARSGSARRRAPSALHPLKRQGIRTNAEDQVTQCYKQRNRCPYGTAGK